MNSESSDSGSAFAWFSRLTQLLSNEPQDREQLLSLLRDAQQRNLFSIETLRMIEGALQVSDLHVRDVMVPRAQMITLPYDGGPDEILEVIVDSGHSRFPVVGDNRDSVQGILLAKDFLAYYAQRERQPFSIRELLRPAVYIPESKRLSVLLREFRASRNHMAIVIDEYGGVAGLVTIEDVIEEIVGDIDDEHDAEEEIYIKPRGQERYTVRALTPIETFNEYFKSAFSDEEFDTIGGLLLQAFGHLPKRGEYQELSGFLFEVLRADNRRIHLLRVKRLPPQEPSAAHA